MLGRAEPYERDHFDRHDVGAMPRHAPDRGLFALGAARADRIAHEVDAPAGVEEAEHGLHDADMRLAAGDDDLPPIGEPGLLPRRSLQDIENEQNPDFVPEDFDPDIGLADPRDLVGAQPYEHLPDEAPAPNPAPSE